MRNKIIFVVILILTLLVILFFAQSSPMTEITFNISNDDISVRLEDPNREEIDTFKESKKIGVSTIGDYKVIVESQDKNRVTTSEIISIEELGNDITYDVNNPDYSEEYISGFLKSQRNDINIASNGVRNGFKVEKDTLLVSEDVIYYAGILYSYETFEVKRFVLHFKEGKWVVIAQPDYILSAYENPDIPIDVLGVINSTRPF